ncbi:MAG: site-2 protease family protein [Candidatus Marinimicrobia bacterium]|nr:site-2 protease family protein [Candidatus Neomarinimicrobiota bacterium]
MNLQEIILLIPPILLALTFHEYMHGYVAYKLGDPTPKMAGRLSLNPLIHLDPLGTIMLFIVRFGWARPVPVNPSYFRDPKRGMLYTSLAGPSANMVIALLSGLFLRILRGGFLEFLPDQILKPIAIMTILSIQINVALAIFNLLPIPPLDGSKIFFSLLPKRYEEVAFKYERYGSIILFGIIMISWGTGISIFGAIIYPFVDFFTRLFGGI